MHFVYRRTRYNIEMLGQVSERFNRFNFSFQILKRNWVKRNDSHKNGNIVFSEQEIGFVSRAALCFSVTMRQL